MRMLSAPAAAVASCGAPSAPDATGPASATSGIGWGSCGSKNSLRGVPASGLKPARGAPELLPLRDLVCLHQQPCLSEPGCALLLAC